MANQDHVTYALDYASRGWPVLPLNGKRPAIKHGAHGATRDVSFLKKRFMSGPNIGIQTGAKSGIVVVDIDPRNGGDATFSDLIVDHGMIPDTLQAITGGGGSHIFFKHPGVKLRGKLGEGIDVKSDGGFVVAPPSVHPDTKKRYKWRNEFEVAAMPEWMLTILTLPATKRELEKSIPDGEGNVSLLQIGHDLKKSGASAQKILTHLLETNLTRLEKPLPDEEVHQIAENVIDFESGRPFKTQWQEGVLSDATLTMYQRGVLMALSMYMDANGRECWPAMETMSIRFHLSRDSLSKALNAGIERGWLKRYRRPKPQNTPGKQKWSYGYVALQKDV